VPDLPELVALLYRTDWTHFSLSATVGSRRDRAVDRQLHNLAMDEMNQVLGPVPRPWRLPEYPLPAETDQPEREQHIVLAPGGRYRIETDDGSLAAVSDGESHWVILGGVARRCPTDGPHPKPHGLLTPQWLIARYDLALTGRTQAGARSAHRVTARPRAVSSRSGHGHYHLLDRVDVIVDAELGIILRSEQVFRGQTLKVAELRDLSIDPPRSGDPGVFELPSGMLVDDHPVFGTFEPRGPGWQAAIIAADVTASAMGFAVRHAPGRPAKRAAGDTEPDMPPDAHDVAAMMTSLVPPSDDVVNLLHRTGLPAQDFDAELHQWLDAGTVFDALQAFRSALPQPIEGIFGPDALWDAVGERGRWKGTIHRTARLQVSMPSKYRIDYLTGDWRTKFKAMACDGEHTRKLYANRVATGPAKPPEQELAALLDAAWLLKTWTLRAGGEVSVASRRGFRIVAEAPDWPARAGFGQLFSPIESVVDAELGILLRQTSYVNGRPAMRSELRNVTASTRPADFRIDAKPGLRTVTDTGGPFADQDLPTPVKAVGTAAALAAGGAIAGAVAVTGWLQKRRARADFHDRG
jgi:outer membrane lipoprotein-sorting protein